MTTTTKFIPSVIAALSLGLSACEEMENLDSFDEASLETSAEGLTCGNGSGTLRGGASWIPGIEGTAVSLNGTTGYISMPSSTFVANEANYTLAAWVKTGLDTSGIVYGENGVGVPRPHVALNINDPAPGDIYFEHRDDAGVSENGVVHTRNDAHPRGLSDNVWHHIALVRTAGSSWTLCYDGVATAIPEASNPGVTTTTMAGLGAMLYPTPDYFRNGALDSVRTYRRALSGAEISALFSPDLCFVAP